MEEKSLSIEDKLDLKRKNRTEKGKLSSDKKNEKEVDDVEDNDDPNKKQKRMSFKERRASKGSFDTGRKASFSDNPKIMRVSFSKSSENEPEQSVLVHTVSVQPDAVLHVEVEDIDRAGRKVNIRGSFEILPDGKGSQTAPATSNTTATTTDYFVLNDGITFAKNVQPTEQISVALSATADVDEALRLAATPSDSQKEEILKCLKENNHTIARVDSGIKIEELLEQHVAQGAETAFYICDINVVLRKWAEWKKLLPRVHPFYAMKCCPDPVLLQILRKLGAGFDVASMGEIGLALNLHTPLDLIIYANPIKQKAHIEFAKQNNVKLMTFDSAAELHKVKEYFPEAQMVLRVLPPESKFIANTSFGSKFGATWDDCEHLIDTAKSLGLTLRGVSYHVGSGCYALEAFEDAVRYARKIFDLAQSKGIKMDFLDIGGGFPGCNDGPISMTDIANRISPVIDELFPKEVTVIAEPGRYFATECMTLASNIVTVREKKVPDGQGGFRNQRLYYLSDGVYGSFNCIFFDHMEPTPHVLSGEKSKQTETRNSTLFGPTCDSIDVICKDVSLPELEIGDWLYFPNMGAYTRAAGSNFNGFPIPKVIYLCS